MASTQRLSEKHPAIHCVVEPKSWCNTIQVDSGAFRTDCQSTGCQGVAELLLRQSHRPTQTHILAVLASEVLKLWGKLTMRRIQGLNRTLLAITLATGLISLAGCGDGRPSRVPVSGQVLIDGQPLTHGEIIFMPENARSAQGTLDGQGRFTLTTFPDSPGDGVVKGRHLVRVVSRKVLSGAAQRWLAPRQYLNPQESQLTVEINGPTDNLQVNLTWGVDPHHRGPWVETAAGGGE